ncbi:hypothetical protein QR680_008738 [Steinernema hermaphroditum]|uniref:Uncharacterized protein n=1 Tax=Steinernema hermaphroditum TaxID=289476 RepID=A0AA39IJZ0_9BILA|nr:hypothetical protein QR680_008738 [Steinernema hermaphroditum]
MVVLFLLFEFLEQLGENYHLRPLSLQFPGSPLVRLSGDRGIIQIEGSFCVSPGSSELTIVFVVSLLATELFALPVPSAEVEVELETSTVPHHKHRHHRHHSLHKKRRSLPMKTDKDARGRGKMMLTKPYWPWP